MESGLNLTGRQATPRRRIRARLELAYTLTDFSAGATFLAGSTMILLDQWTHVGHWCFVVGSVLFTLKPCLRVIRETRLAARGDDHALEQRERRQV